MHCFLHLYVYSVIGNIEFLLLLFTAEEAGYIAFETDPTVFIPLYEN